MKTLFCFLMLCLAGCGAQEKINAIKSETDQKLVKLQNTRIIYVRLNDHSLDLVTNEGEIITVYSYCVTSAGDVLYCNNIGVK